MTTVLKPDFPRPRAAQLAALQTVGSALLYQALGQRGALHSSIKPLQSGRRLLGPAFTAGGFPGDNLTGHAAITLAQPGDILVYTVDGFIQGASFGDMMAAVAASRGLGGILIDGAVRDAATLRSWSLPVFSRGISLKSRGEKARLGPLAAPLVVAGVEIAPGDLIVGDDDGVIAVPYALIDVAIERVRQLTAEKENLLRRFSSDVSPADWERLKAWE
ncbi:MULTISPECIES: RraA family protein [unclassified Brenneria]|uniref:RraA family protein n=1 Tax=unclassified Brenneria TaxID=2634434 RepID=UPI0029C230D7|nr:MULTISPECIES: RraA family protein [unclassified Brenneria]MDX5630912.1 RraA family protein [Brenneria sp. L3-3Z]MDX5697994.1 RraA family protein [Brenneria sp. L4-2C]